MTRHEVDALLPRSTVSKSSLRAQGEERWADWVARDAAWMRRGDFYGVEPLLRAFGGMGSLNDVLVDPANGNAATSEEAASLNRRFDELSGRAYEAKGLTRERDAAA